MPCQDRELRNVIKRAKYAIGDVHPEHRMMSRDCDILLASLFKREIDLFRLKNLILEDLDSVTQCTPLELFKLVDVMDKGVLDHLTLKEFLLLNGHFSTKEELIAIIRRIDTDGDSKIKYHEFVQFITKIDYP